MHFRRYSAFVCSLDSESKKIEMTFKSGDLSQRSKSSRVALSDLKEGQKAEGVVSRIEDYGLFVQIKNSKLNGLCHKSEVGSTLFWEGTYLTLLL